MEEKQKVQVVFEFDRSEYDAYLFLMNQKKTEEVEQVWNAMSGEPVVADIDLLEEDSQSVKLMMISLAILSIYKAMKLILEHEHIDLLIKPVSRKYS